MRGDVLANGVAVDGIPAAAQDRRARCGLADPDGWRLMDAGSSGACGCRAIRTGLTIGLELTRRQIPASLSSHARTRASSALPVFMSRPFEPGERGT